jgi:NAD(P)-dependent dehydrogenase (short-subunit alcohol dehydrogenase family)
MRQEKVAPVTGVSSGIGRAIAGLLSRHGFRVFGTARGNGGAKRALENVEWSQSTFATRGRSILACA